MKSFNKLIDTAARIVARTKQKNFTVSIEGNIASGKTSFLNFLKGNQLCQITEEPVAKWRNINGENALAKLYEDAARWSLALQTYVQLTMVEGHTAKQTKPVKLMERSLFSAKYCFVENLYKGGMMEKMEYDILTRWFDWIVENQDVHVDLIVYLRTKPEILIERIQRRGRNEEKPIPLEYLKQLHELHDDWLIKKKFPVHCPVLVINANISLEEMERICERYQRQILCGLQG